MARIASDGRYAMAADHAAHSSLSWVTQPSGAFLYGMTDKSPVELLPLAKAWIHPPPLKVLGDSFASDGYNQDQRAYLLKRTQAGGNLEVELAGSAESPVVNPALVIQGWGDHEATLKLDGVEVPRGPSFRYGHRRTLEGTDLVVWIKTTSEKLARFTLVAGS